MSMQKTARSFVGVNERGQRVGETHPGAKLTDHDLDLMFELRASGMQVAEIARKFEITRKHASAVLNYRARNHLVVRWRRVTP